jgi:hypothetical protein
MSAKDLKDLLEHLDDTYEIVLTPLPEEDELPFPVEELLVCWRDAEEEAGAAFQLWRECPGTEAYAVYLAAADRAEAAQDALRWNSIEAGIGA